MKWIAALLCLLATSCSPSNDVANEAAELEDQADIAGSAETTATTGEMTTAELMPYIPAALMEDLDVLQSAIFYKYDESMSACMRTRGWDHDEPVLEIAAAPTYQSQAEQLLGNLRSLSDGGEDDDNTQAPGISDAATEQERIDFQECFDTNQWKVGHPLVDGSDWLAEAYDSANERTHADENWQASKIAADACFETEGHGTYPEALQAFDDQLDEIRASDIPLEQAIAELEALVGREETVDGIADRCFDEHQQLTRQLYHEYLADEVTGSPELQAEIAKMQETVDRYRDVLDELQTTQ